MMRDRRLLKVFLLLVLVLCSTRVFADCYSDTEMFDPNQGYSWNHMWSHCLNNIPSDCTITSAQIEVRAQVWYWGWYPYEQDILSSNTNVFNYSEGYVCSLTTLTHPNSSNFHTITCDLTPGQSGWVLDDQCMNFNMVTFGGTYYLDHATLTVCCSDQVEPVIDSITFDSCISELCKSSISVTARDPYGGNLIYAWEALDGGEIMGEGADVQFDPPDNGLHPCPYQVELTVTSDISGLSTSETMDIYVKLAGDVDGNGTVNVLDKVQVRNHFGESGDPGWVEADVDCNGVVNILDKVEVRNQFGQTGCECP